jgi:hypothetical protein
LPSQSNDDSLKRELEELRAALQAAQENNRLTEERLAVMLDNLKGAVEQSMAIIRKAR